MEAFTLPAVDSFAQSYSSVMVVTVKWKLSLASSFVFLLNL